MNKKLLLVICLLFLSEACFAWGPLTHMWINYQAYLQARDTPGFILPKDENSPLVKAFIQGAPSPDIREMLDGFPVTLHGNQEVIMKMVDRAIRNPKYGMTDVAMALGWAGHFFGEEWTAHKDGATAGYPNAKTLFTVAGSQKTHHDINELMVEIYLYHKYKNKMASWLSEMPVTLLFDTIKEDGLSAATNTQKQIIDTENLFRFSSLGAKTIAQHLEKYRPRIIADIDRYFADVQPEIDLSIQFVRDDLLKKKAVNITKKNMGSVDASLPSKLNAQTALNMIKQSNAVRNFEVGLTGIISGLLSKIQGIVDANPTQLFFESKPGKKVLEELQNTLNSKVPKGDTDYKNTMGRFVLGLLVRTDWGFEDVLQYAQGSKAISPGLKITTIIKREAKELANEVKDNVTDAAGDVKDKVVDKIKDAGTAIVAGATKVVEKAKNLGTKAVKALKKLKFW
jgi:hypothetical protein